MPATNNGAGSSLFANPQSTSLFGGSNQNQNMGGSSFYGAQNQQQQPGASAFGLTAVPASQLNQPSMLGASQYRQSQYAGPFQGKLSMGQGGAAPNTQTVGAVKVDLENLRSTTRFADCIDAIKEQFEAVDKMIQNQEAFCKSIENMLAPHSVALGTLGPDVKLITEKADDAEQMLAMDAQGVDEARKTVDRDCKDFERSAKVVGELRLPAAYQSGGVYGGGGSSFYGTRTTAGGEVADDNDLISKYFVPLTSELQSTLSTYAANLTEIESHMRVIEGSTVTQAQQLAARRAGTKKSGAGGDETVRELADTLRGFEHSILGVAGVVGQCREGVNGLVLGRLGDGVKDRGRVW